MKQAQADVKVRVKSLWDTLENASEVADQVKRDASFSDIQRCAAQGMVLREACGRRGKQAMLFSDASAGPKPLQPLDRELVTALAGRYEGKHGMLLMIEGEGQLMRAEIHWSPPSGPVTRAILGLGDAGNILLDDGSPELIDIEIERDGDQPVRSVSILDDSYRRLHHRDDAPSKPAKQR